MIRAFRSTFIALLALASLSACATITPGHIGLKVDLYGAEKTEFLDAVFEEVVEKTGANGIIVEELFVVGTFFLPDEVYASINSTQKAEQDALMRTNEIESTKAEAQKAIEEARGAAESIRLRAEAEANANREIAESISPALIDYYRVQAWDGVMPRVTGSEGLIIDLSPDDQ